MAGAEVNAIGRLWEGRPEWFGIARTGGSVAADASAPDHALVFGEPDGTRRTVPLASGGGERGVLLALIAFFEGDVPGPPPELEMTQWEAADAVRWLAERASAENAHQVRPDVAAPLRSALDAIDDGLPADVVTGFLYRALGNAPGGDSVAGSAPIEELRRTYERLGR